MRKHRERKHQDNISVKYIPPKIPFLYSKTGINMDMHSFLFLLSKIDCGYLLEPPRRGGPNVYPLSMF